MVGLCLDGYGGNVGNTELKTPDGNTRETYLVSGG